MKNAPCFILTIFSIGFLTSPLKGDSISNNIQCSDDRNKSLNTMAKMRQINERTKRASKSKSGIQSSIRSPTTSSRNPRSSHLKTGDLKTGDYKQTCPWPRRWHTRLTMDQWQRFKEKCFNGTGLAEGAEKKCTEGFLLCPEPTRKIANKRRRSKNSHSTFGNGNRGEGGRGGGERGGDRGGARRGARVGAGGGARGGAGGGER